MADLTKSNGSAPPDIPVMSEDAFKIYQLAGTLSKAGKHESAAILFRRGIALAPWSGQMLNGLGAALFHVYDYAGAEETLAHAIAVDPNDSGPHCNLGLVLAAQGRFDEAEKEYRAALAIKDRIDTRWNLSFCLLSSGDWKRGFEEYEYRLKDEELYPPLPYPPWNGEDLDGKTLYVNPEQGAGDVIMVSRYLPWIKERWPTARVLFYCPQILIALFWEFRHVVEFLPPNIPHPEADFGVHLMSLPRIHGTTPENIPSDPGLILKRSLQDTVGINLTTDSAYFKVGIAWTGNLKNLENADRSIPLETMLRIAENPAVVPFSLQVDHGVEDIERLAMGNVVVEQSTSFKKGGFATTAAYVRQMDLIVTVSTSTAHVAGALGVPTLLLLHHDPYWAWLRGRDDCVWYPSVRLIRQTRLGDWGPVIAAAQDIIAERVRAAPPPNKTAEQKMGA